MKLLKVAPALLVVVAGACRPSGPAQPVAPMDVTADIRVLNDQFEAAFSAGDVQAVAAMYTEDGMLLPPGSDFVTGREAIQAFWQGALDSGVGRAVLTSAEAVGAESLAVEIGRYEMFTPGDSLVDEGKYMVWWKLTPDGWRLHRDTWNSSRPAM
jgi:uncharacterized protein (TIGR02246 family)